MPKRFLKIFTLSALVIVLTLSMVPITDWSVVGVSRGCALSSRLCYPFFHASLLHAALNAWCFVSILFLYDLSWPQVAVAYIIAVVAPDFALSSVPTVGLSGVCFALLGSIAFQVKRKRYYNACMALYITLGFLFPLVNGWLHLYSYVAGLFVGFLTMPLSCRR